MSYLLAFQSVDEILKATIEIKATREVFSCCLGCLLCGNLMRFRLVGSRKRNWEFMFIIWGRTKGQNILKLKVAVTFPVAPIPPRPTRDQARWLCEVRKCEFRPVEQTERAMAWGVTPYGTTFWTLGALFVNYPVNILKTLENTSARVNNAMSNL